MEKHLGYTVFGGKRIHLGVSGSVACYKALDLLRQWKDCGISLSATLTKSARQFVSPLLFEALGASPVYDAMFASESPSGTLPDIFPHLTPVADIDAFLFVGASATTMARIAQGMADDILAAQALAYPGSLVFAPSMNPRMWANPATQDNCRLLRSRGHRFVGPVSGRVACMETGSGRLADSREIFVAGLKAVAEQDMQGKTVLVTCGPTREFWDGVRFWSNPSTGTMGAAVAVSAYLRGATVHAICGPGVPWMPEAIHRHDVVSANDMFVAAQAEWPLCDIGVFTAAVADFAPVAQGSEKFKKDSLNGALSIAFSPNVDILQSLAKGKKAHQQVVGFAAETSDVQKHAQAKLERKNADLIVGNIVNVPDSGFGGELNTAFVAFRGGKSEEWPTMSKADMSWRILDCLLRQ